MGFDLGASAIYGQKLANEFKKLNKNGNVHIEL